MSTIKQSGRVALIAVPVIAGLALGPAVSANAAVNQVDPHSGKVTLASGSKTCKSGQMVRLDVKYPSLMQKSKVIYNISRTSEQSVGLPPGAGGDSNYNAHLKISTMKKSSSYYVSAPSKYKKASVSIKAYCVSA